MKPEEENNQQNGNIEVNEPAAVYQPEGPLTFEKLWQVFPGTLVALTIALVRLPRNTSRVRLKG